MDHSVDERRERLEDAAGEAGPAEHSAPPRADGHGGAGGAPGGHGAGHDKHAGHSVAMFRDRFWLTLGLTVPVVLLSHDVQTWLGSPEATTCPRSSARSSSCTAASSSWGFDLPMAVGAILMSVSTIVVAANAQLLRGLRLSRGAAAGPRALPLPA